MDLKLELVPDCSRSFDGCWTSAHVGLSLTPRGLSCCAVAWVRHPRDDLSSPEEGEVILLVDRCAVRLLLNFLVGLLVPHDVLDCVASVSAFRLVPCHLFMYVIGFMNVL